MVYSVLNSNKYEHQKNTTKKTKSHHIIVRDTTQKIGFLYD